MEEPKNKYVILQETIPDEYVQVYNFLKYNGNEEALAHLHSQIESVDWTVYKNYACFDIDIDTPVSEETASEMIRVDLNIYTHRKFDGVLQMVDLGLLPSLANKKKIKKVNAVIGGGRIDRFIDKEDIYEDTMSCHSDADGSGSDEGSTSSSGSSSDDSSDSSDSFSGSESEGGREEEKFSYMVILNGIV